MNRLPLLLNLHLLLFTSTHTHAQHIPPRQIDFRQVRHKASEFSGVCETMLPRWHHLHAMTGTVCSMEINRRIVRISHLWNNLFTLVWLHPAGRGSLGCSVSCSFTASLSPSLSPFHTLLSALLCTMIFYSQTFFPGMTHSLNWICFN